VRRPLMVAAGVVIAAVGVLSGGAVSRGKPDLCARNPGHPKCRTTTSLPPPTTGVPTGTSTGELRANLWLVP
jgi:hypothetical protein